MSTLTDFSNDLAAVVKGAGPAVVRIEGRRRLPATGVMWSADGYVLTADHVVRADEGVKVGLDDGRVLDAAVVGRDRSTDLALLKVESSEHTPLVLTGDQDLAVGSLVLALGRPGKSVQATVGILSAVGSNWNTRRGGHIDQFIQTDVLMYPGFSGGPLVTADGRLLGLNSSALVQGISVTLPVTTLQRVAAGLQEHGRLRRGYLGVSTQIVRLPQPAADAAGQRNGLLVVAVEEGSPAEQAGITLGDTIVALGDAPVRSHDDLLAQLVISDLNEKVPVRIVRAGELVTINVKLGEAS